LVVATYRGSGTVADTSAGLLARLSADPNTERVDVQTLGVDVHDRDFAKLPWTRRHVVGQR
jgi:hypothetical protein